MFRHQYQKLGRAQCNCRLIPITPQAIMFAVKGGLNEKREDSSTEMCSRCLFCYRLLKTKQ